MEVILLEKIGKLGKVGDRVTVKPGYGRNYLIPGGKAVRASKTNIAEFEAKRAELETAATAKLSEAEARAAKLQALTVRITAVAGEEGKLFGSVGTRDIASAIVAAGVEVNKAEVKLPQGPLREVGAFDISLQLHTDVSTTVKVEVVAEA